ncbi:helix-turn-helix transcriptional regulator [Paenibacillus sp. P26]|nr:helix-turn-helix transcriptional regulator [Paenibacillus sp. P26]
MNDDVRRRELGQFLRTRRERLTPAMFEPPVGAKRRRTPGLRREELSQLAGISPTWYTKLEQGQEIQVSAQVLESLARVLQLTPDERKHLYVLAREQLPLPASSHPSRMGPELQQMLDALQPNPAFVLNERWDILGWNLAASRVFTDFGKLSDWERNFVWIMFAEPDQRTLYMHWEYWARKTIAMFRTSGGREAGEPWFNERRDRLMEASPEFRDWWEEHEVSEPHRGHKEFCHPAAGTLHFQSTAPLVGDDPSLRLFLYTPPPKDHTLQKLLELIRS